jgi:predicted PurR-regulated permease PerM
LNDVLVYGDTFPAEEVLPKIHLYRGTRIFIIIAAPVIIVRGVNLVQSVPVMFFVSIFLSVIGTPMMLWLQRKRFPSVVGVLWDDGRHACQLI